MVKTTNELSQAFIVEVIFYNHKNQILLRMKNFLKSILKLTLAPLVKFNNKILFNLFLFNKNILKLIEDCAVLK